MKHVRDMTQEECAHQYINKMQRAGTIMRVMECMKGDRVEQAHIARKNAIWMGGDPEAIKAMFSAYFEHGELSDADGELTLVS